MTNFSLLAQEIREVGESVFSNSQDLFLLLDLKVSNDVETTTKIRHGLNLVENILSILMYVSILDLEIFDHHENLMNEVDKIKYSCHELQKTMSKMTESGKPTLNKRKYLLKLLTAIKNSANKIITISYLFKKSHKESLDVESYSEESENICYEDRQTCEQYCPNGFCIEDKAKETETPDSYCSEYTESFTPSTLTHVENGYEGDEHMPWHVTKDKLNVGSVNEHQKYSIWDIIKRKFSPSIRLKEIRRSEITYSSKENLEHDILNTPNEFQSEHLSETKFETSGTFGTEKNEYTIDAPEASGLQNKSEPGSRYEIYEAENESDNSPTTEEQLEVTSSTNAESITTDNLGSVRCSDEATKWSYSEELATSAIYYTSTLNHETVSNSETTDNYETETLNYETTNSYEATSNSYETTTDSYETTSNSYETTTDSYEATTNSYETTSDSYETTTNSYETTTDSYETTNNCYETSTAGYETTTPSYETTTPSYETTTQDMYRLSQDIYQAAQDLSSKSNEISSMSSEISSKSSDISSLVSELNNYEDEELSKKIQGVSKLTQEINSKTSEISSLTSTMSSLASDIGSASSDMTSGDRHHAFRTTPWQKMSSKSDDLVTNAQGVVTAGQDILARVTEVVSATADLKVAASVANLAGQIAAKTQRLISEALSIVTKVIELVSVIDS